MSQPWGLHWFRRDLRIVDNQALRENWQKTQGRTIGIFSFDSEFLARSDFSHNRFAFFLKTLVELKKDWQAQGGDLLVTDCEPQKAFHKLLEELKRKNLAMPSVVSWNRDYEPYARTRDKKVEEFLKSKAVSVVTRRDHLFFEPDEITKDDGSFYQVFSPYCRSWFRKMDSPDGQKRLCLQGRAESYFNMSSKPTDLFKTSWKEIFCGEELPFRDSLSEFVEKNRKHVTISIPCAGFSQAFQRLQKFKDRVGSYGHERDIPSLDGTSQLSAYFKNGSLTVPQVLAYLRPGHWHFKREDGLTKYLKELVWREFYYSIIFHRPEVEGSAFLKQFRNLRWENDETYFERWKEGATGFPIVDAGMRQLKTTGWMHNRVRMIVASFLTKDLLIDWKWGENYFMKELLDGDLACNNGGWQWAASTGCDPQPYFRIFNPWLQGQKFDRDGTYIRKYVPELRDAPAKVLHSPDADRSEWKYPKPMVNHSLQRYRALALYKV